MSTQQWLVAAVTALLALWAAVFATRADLASRRARASAEQRWQDTIRPLPHLSFTQPPAPGAPIELQVENLGGALAAGAVIVQAGDDLFAGELSMPDRAAPRRIFLSPVMKAWQKSNHPNCLLLVSRDISGRWWDSLAGDKVVEEPARWLPDQLRDLRLQGVVDFPGLTGSAKP